MKKSNGNHRPARSTAVLAHRPGVTRRRFLSRGAAGAAALTLGGCTDSPPPERYTQADVRALAQQRITEAAASGRGPYGVHRYRGYRGLAALPWFELDENGELELVDETVPHSIDMHAHLGISVLFEPRLDLLAATPRVKHLLDCDGSDPGCALDLDIYINGNFDADGLKQLGRDTLTQALWGNDRLRSHTIPNLLREMDAMRVAQSVILPIKTGLPFGDRLTERWRSAAVAASADERLLVGLSVHPDDPDNIAQLEHHAAAGTRIMKLHPTVQQFYPDDRKLFPLYQRAQELGVTVFFHGGRAGIEPEDRLRYALPRHYAAVLENFPLLPVVLGHAGARDNYAMLDLAMRHSNAWLGIHGQSVSNLERMIERTGGKRLLFGTDWPWYHIGATLAKVLICTAAPARSQIRHSILRENALRLWGEPTA